MKVLKPKVKRRPPPEIKIEKGIPPPEPRLTWQDFFKPLLPGDSFIVQEDKERCRIIVQASRMKIPMISKKLNGTGYRIWRLESKPTKRQEPRILRVA